MAIIPVKKCSFNDDTRIYRVGCLLLKFPNFAAINLVILAPTTTTLNFVAIVYAFCTCSTTRHVPPTLYKYQRTDISSCTQRHPSVASSSPATYSVIVVAVSSAESSRVVELIISSEERPHPRSRGACDFKSVV